MAAPGRWRKGLAAAGVGLLVALATGELGLRVLRPEIVDQAGWVQPVEEGAALHPDQRRCVPDEELGYIPYFGPGVESEYGEHGALRNDYDLEKPAGVERLVFLGDSVTHRAKIVDALRARLGEEGYEYWNLGVEAYGTQQEVGYYERFGAPLAADHVILTLHINDFEVTPIVFRDGDGRLMRFHRYRPQELNPFLWRWSYVYRLWQGLAMRARLENRVEDEMAAEIEEALARLRDLAGRDGARLSVVVLPLIGGADDLPADWGPGSVRRVALAREICARLGIEVHDLTPPHDAAMADGVVVREAPHDPMHPSRFVAEYFADHLLAAGLFDDAGEGGRLR